MDAAPRFSVVVPVFNRPHELRALLASLAAQTITGFEVLVVEDGSAVTSEAVCAEFKTSLNLHYYVKPNSGPGPSRNFGFERARGTYFVMFDSDCRLPPGYFAAVERALQEKNWDAWGGPDRGHSSFTPLQQAMAYTMSSFLTTGGIRGKKKHAGWFQPRSFNMGIHRAVFEKTGGFRFDRYAEDIEFSIRIRQAGFNVGLIPGAYVYHQRRQNLAEFWKQVSNFGRGRVLVGRLYPGELRWVHWLPSAFVMGVILMLPAFIVWPPLGWACLWLFGAFLLLTAADCLRQTRNPWVAALAIPAALVQLLGYGTGFLKAWLGSRRLAR
jgi:glycosyltransferase involved in cell wall biosynthesis